MASENNEKMENLLNLALDATEREREKSIELHIGFDETDNVWEVVVKYGGTRETLLEAFPMITVTGLSNGYAVLQIPQNLVETVAAFPAIEYMEKPKLLFFAVNQGVRSSCILPLQTAVTGNVPQTGTNHLTGKGVIVACIDSGIDYAHPDFLNADGTTRILDLWDQTLVPKEGGAERPPEGFLQGVEYSREKINEALRMPTEAERYAICPSRDISGHGTHVAGIAAGNGRASNGKYRGVAFESELLIVKLGVQQRNAFPRTTQLMEAVDYCIRKARNYGMPIALNLSFGNNYGSHSGTSLIETYLNEMANSWKTTIVIGSGNEGAAGRHTSGVIKQGQMEVVEFAIGEYETGLNLQLWKSYLDEVAVSLVHPSGKVVGMVQRIQGPQRFTIEGTQILLYYGEPSPFSPYQEIYFDFIPAREYVDSGVWELRLIPQKIVLGNYDMWFPSGGVLNQDTLFLRPTAETTLTIPSTAGRAITVGAYDAYYNQYASFSGRGFTRETNQVKPDLAAPGVDITSTAPGGGYAVRTGTSMATPFVTGAAALLMEWGILNGNDPYLYGEKMKAYLLRGARQLPGLQSPNPMTGFGALCVADSLPD